MKRRAEEEADEQVSGCAAACMSVQSSDSPCCVAANEETNGNFKARPCCKGAAHRQINAEGRTEKAGRVTCMHLSPAGRMACVRTAHGPRRRRLFKKHHPAMVRMRTCAPGTHERKGPHTGSGAWCGAAAVSRGGGQGQPPAVLRTRVLRSWCRGWCRGCSDAAP